MRRLAVLSVAVLMLSACGDGQGARGVDGSNEHSLGADSGLFPGSAMWSPDGGKLAIIEDYPFGMEPDIWVVDIASGERTNLTDDGVVQAEWPSPGEFVYPDGAVVDLFPSWSADGERIRFLREYSDGMTLMSIPAGGGDPTRLGSINADWKKLQTVAWAENSIAWTSGTPDDRHSEVWVSSGFGGLPHKVLDGPYRVLSFSADGALLLADQLDRSSEGAVGTAHVVPARVATRCRSPRATSSIRRGARRGTRSPTSTRRSRWSASQATSPAFCTRATNSPRRTTAASTGRGVRSSCAAAGDTLTVLRIDG
jgi:hypothetical protein